MSTQTKVFGQAIGFAVPGWSTRPLPPSTPMSGRYCRVEPLDPARHAEELYEANSLDATGKNWTYLSSDAPPDLPAYRAWLDKMCAGKDPLFHVVIDLASGKAAGVAALMRIDPASGVVEVGHINFSPRLQRTRAATEAIFLMMRRVFDELGYRRYEWKCDSLNAPSRVAALRYGFQFEGIFRQALVYKGRNRDTAWFSMLDTEWPAVKAAFERWLDASNFDASGAQKESLRELMSTAGR